MRLKKNIPFIIICAISMILSFGCGFSSHEAVAPDITEVDLADVKGITEQEAVELCRSVWGEVDEDTGFRLSYVYSGTVEKDGKQYYVIRTSWLVDNSHYSYIGDCFVASDGGEIYDGIYAADECSFADLIWSEGE